MRRQIDDLITVGEAARECRRTTETIRRWIWEGKLRAQKLGNQLFIRRDDLAVVAARGKRRPSSDELAVLEEVRTVRERIRRRIGGTIDVLEALERSHEAHP
jgi:excisionase family DNA binding protein